MNNIEIQKLAKLSRLEISEDQALRLKQQLELAINYFQKISEVNTTGVDPLVNPVEVTAGPRADEVIQKVSPGDILQSAPQKTGHLFTVPPVV